MQDWILIQHAYKDGIIMLKWTEIIIIFEWVVRYKYNNNGCTCIQLSSTHNIPVLAIYYLYSFSIT